MTRPIILAALFAAGTAQAVTPPVANPPAKAPPAAPAAPSNAPKRFPGVSDQGNVTLAKLQTTPDPQLQALGRQAKAAHDQLVSVAMAPVIDMDKVAAALKAQDEALDAVRAHNTDRIIAAARSLSEDDRGTFLRTLVLAQSQRPAPPPAPAKPQP